MTAIPRVQSTMERHALNASVDPAVDNGSLERAWYCMTCDLQLDREVEVRTRHLWLASGDLAQSNLML